MPTLHQFSYYIFSGMKSNLIFIMIHKQVQLHNLKENKKVGKGFREINDLPPWIIRASLVAQQINNPLAMQETWFDSWVRKTCWRRDRLPTPVFLGFPGGSVGKESACNAGDLGLIPGLGRFPWRGNGYPLQYSGLENSSLENSMDYIVHGLAKNKTGLSVFHWITELEWTGTGIKTRAFPALN